MANLNKTFIAGEVLKASELNEMVAAINAKQEGLTSAQLDKLNNASEGGYEKPETGIPASDLSASVQASLANADSALQSFTETDPVFTAHPAYSITQEKIDAWDNNAGNNECTVIFTENVNDLVPENCLQKLILTSEPALYAVAEIPGSVVSQFTVLGNTFNVDVDTIQAGASNASGDFEIEGRHWGIFWSDLDRTKIAFALKSDSTGEYEVDQCMDSAGYPTQSYTSDSKLSVDVTTEEIATSYKFVKLSPTALA